MAEIKYPREFRRTAIGFTVPSRTDVFEVPLAANEMIVSFTFGPNQIDSGEYTDKSVIDVLVCIGDPWSELTRQIDLGAKPLRGLRFQFQEHQAYVYQDGNFFSLEGLDLGKLDFSCYDVAPADGLAGYGSM